MRVAKTKALISFAVTAKLICVFVFAYADCWFSHEAAHFMYNMVSLNCIFLSKASCDSKYGTNTLAILKMLNNLCFVHYLVNTRLANLQIRL